MAAHFHRHTAMFLLAVFALFFTSHWFEAAAAPGACSSSEHIKIRDAGDVVYLTQALNDCVGSFTSFSVSWDVADVTLHETIRIRANNTVQIATKQAETPTIKGNGSVQLFYVEYGATLALEGLRLANGYADYDVYTGGGAIYCGGNLLLNACEVEDGFAWYYGGGVYLDTVATADISFTNFTGNVGSSGGALYVAEGSAQASVVDCRFSSNRASSGRAGALYRENGPTMFLNRTVFYNNSALSAYGENIGGAIDNWGDLVLSECVFVENRALLGGAVSNSAGNMTLSKCNFCHNAALSGGGALWVADEIQLIDGCTFTNNTAIDMGGALGVPPDESGIIRRLENSVFEGNAVLEGDGGAIYTADVLGMFNTSVSSNHASGAGGGIFAARTSALHAYDCRVTGNSAIDRGAGVSIGNYSVFERCHVSGNKAEAGGGIFVASGAQLSVSNTVFAENEAGNGAALFLIWRAAAESHGCSFEDNRATTYGTVFIQSGATDYYFVDTSFRNNSAAFGGAVFSESSIDAAFSGCSFSSCFAAEGGAAIFLSGNLRPPAGLLSGGSFAYEGSTASCCHAVYASLYGADCSSVDGNSGLDTIFSSACCTSGQYALVEESGSPSCQDCPANFDCASLGATLGSLPLKPHYWRASNYSTLARLCWNTAACLGGSDAEEYCKSGYTGPYCAACEQGYASGIAYACYACSSGAVVGTIVALCLAVLLVAGVVWYIFAGIYDLSDRRDSLQAAANSGAGRRAVSALRRVSLGPLRVTVVVWQIITQFVAITGLRLPPVLESFFSWLNAINLDFGWILSASCAIDIDFYGRVLFVTVAPLLLLALLGCSLCMRICRIERWSPRGPMPERDRADWRESHKKIAVQRHIKVALVLSFLVYSTVSTMVFQVFACDTFGASEYADWNGSESFLRADYSLSCDAPKHKRYVIYAAIMILLYPVGIPVLYAWTLWRGRQQFKAAAAAAFKDEEIVMENSPLEATSFIWRPYVWSCYWWELVECVRRLCLTGILVFILPGSSGQAAVACVFAVGSLAVFARYVPMKEPLESQMYILGCVIIFLTTFLGLLIKVGASNPDSQSQEVLSILVIVLNVVLIVGSILQIVFAAAVGTSYLKSSHYVSKRLAGFGRKRNSEGEEGEEEEAAGGSAAAAAAEGADVTHSPVRTEEKVEPNDSPPRAF